MVVRVATRTVLQRWSLSLNFFLPNFDRHQSIHARIRAHATHSAFHSLSTTSFYIGLALPSILEIYVGSEPGCSWCIEPQLTQWETNLLISLLFDNKRQGLSNHGHFPRPTAEARKGGGKLSLGQAGPVRLLVSSSAQHDLPRYLGPCFRGIPRYWPTPPLPTFWPFWPLRCPNRKQEHLIIRGGATSCCCCSLRLTTTGTSQESIHRAPSDHTSAVSYSTPAAHDLLVPLSQASSRVNWLLQGLAVYCFLRTHTSAPPPGIAPGLTCPKGHQSRQNGRSICL